MAVKIEHFGFMPDGRAVQLYTMTNANGVSASFTDLGAVWVKMIVPDREGNLADVILGYENADGYLKNGPHMGAVVGRIANRTGGAAFSLNGELYTLGKNEGSNNLHSGPDYFDTRLWTVKNQSEEDSKNNEMQKNEITFVLESPDGDQGFPGNMTLSVTYTLTECDAVEITYEAICDKDTPMAFTSHGYFNLGGHDSGSILEHEVQIFADAFTPTDLDKITTGEIEAVSGTPMDFRKPKKICEEICSEYLPLKIGKGYDHNFCLDHEAGVYALAASVYDEKSGRTMEVYTDLPGLQFYSGNYLNGEVGKNDVSYHDYDAYCFESQFYPDSVNKPQFASPVIKAGIAFRSKTGYYFDVRS